MTCRSALLLFPVLLLLSLPCRADGGGDPPETVARYSQAIPLSLAQAVGIALSPGGNTRIRIAQELVRQAEARSVQSRAALLPNIDASVSQQSMTRNLAAFGIRIQLPIPGYESPTFVGPFNIFDARAGASLNVLNLSSIRRYQASRRGIRQAEAEQEYARDEVRSTVARVYLSLLKARAGEEAARSSVALAERLLELAEDRKSAGAGTGIEITRARVQLANERQRLLAAENEVERARFQLLRTLGLDMDLEVEPIEKMTFEPMEIQDPRQALETALESRADWKAQQKKEETARLSHSAARMERLPSVSLFADYGAIGSSIHNAVPTRAYGFAVEVPIFDGGRRDGRRAESSSRLRQEREILDDLRKQIELDIRLALDSLQSADLQVAAAEEGLNLAQDELARAQRRFMAGVGSSIEVTDAQTRLERARDNRIQALFIHNSARIDLHSAMGTIRQMIPGDGKHDQEH
ncbi:MAG: TolC family protein [Acidobacteria bacterium]|nr:TolC family protein [Acidobacteriota bacterium]